mmetsp:Transcript_18890/g.51999  ORF Transcript_18890/g.51999 Transcript_18890/m.51999 type:complete len:130 (-) Transcript_18890:1464-1853(-)
MPRLPPTTNAAAMTSAKKKASMVHYKPSALWQMARSIHMTPHERTEPTTRGTADADAATWHEGPSEETKGRRTIPQRCWNATDASQSWTSPNNPSAPLTTAIARGSQSGACKNIEGRLRGHGTARAAAA